MPFLANIIKSNNSTIMKPPPYNVPPPPSIGKFEKIKRLRAVRDQTLPLYTTPIRTRYAGIQGVKPRMLSQQASIGNHEADKPHLRSLPLRNVSKPITHAPAYCSHDRSNQAARPFTGLSLMGLQKKARFNNSNVDYTQTRAPIIYSFS